MTPERGMHGYNRERLFRRIDSAIDSARGQPVGLLLLRAERFHQLSGFLGYEAVDDLVAAVQNRIGAVVRESDHLIPLGNCDFAVILPNLGTANRGTLAGHRLLRAFDEPFDVKGQPVTVLVNIGLALSPDHGFDADSLCRCAERAVVEARNSRHGFAVVGDDEDEVALYEDLRKALVDNALELAFQPVFDMRDRRIVGVESLARWNCPKRGAVSPLRFVKLAEDTGLAAELTRWSVNASLREHAQLRRLEPALRCSINLSPRVFSQAGLVEQVIDAISLWSATPESIVLEVTESAMMEDPERSAAMLGRFSSHGVGIAIDDFGKGYSSFSYLKHFSADELKIDQSFVFDAVSDPRSEQLVRSMVDLAHHLNMAAVAEGIEDEETAQLLGAMGCERAQGFHLARPMPSDAVAALLQAQRSDPPADG